MLMSFRNKIYKWNQLLWILFPWDRFPLNSTSFLLQQVIVMQHQSGEHTVLYKLLQGKQFWLKNAED